MNQSQVPNKLKGIWISEANRKQGVVRRWPAIFSTYCFLYVVLIKSSTALSKSSGITKFEGSQPLLRILNCEFFMALAVFLAILIAKLPNVLKAH
jgi:hypothetical protein